MKDKEEIRAASLVDIEEGTSEQKHGETEQVKELQRGLKPRHVNMFAIAGSLGTGLIIGMGKSLAVGGPGSLFLAYVIMGITVYFVLTALAEMAVFAPHKKGFSGYATRYMDPALGFATGWNYFFKYSILLANNLTAAGLIISYWRDDINVGVWIAVFGVCIVGLNFMKVQWFGEAEFWMASMKVIIILVLIFTCFVISLGGSPSGERIGFRYWSDPGAFAQYKFTGSAGYFGGFWSCFIQAAFMYMGLESVAITFGEAKNPRKTIPRALKQTIWRVIVFYFGGVLAISMAVPYTNELLLGATKAKTSAAASPFVVAVRLAGIRYMPDIINASLLVFVFSFSNSDIYLASRTLYGLAKDGQAPLIFTKTTKHGVPYNAVIAASLFICLAFLNVSTSSGTAFGYFVSVTTVLGSVNWANILITYFSFQRGLKAQGIRRTDLPWRGNFHPYAAYFSFFITVLVLITSGWEAFTPIFDPRRFVVAYVGVVSWIIMILGWKFYKGTKMVQPKTMDLQTGVRDYTLEPEEEEVKKTFIARVKGAIWGG